MILMAILSCFVKLYANNSHLITKVENMIETDDTYYITSFIESNKDYRSLGSFYEELLDSLSTHNDDLEYYTIFARSGANSLLRKAEELQYSNRSMADNLKKSSTKILDKAIDTIYDEWLEDDNDCSFLLKNALDMMKLSFRINTQLQNDLREHYLNYISYGELYLSLNEFSSALEYFRIAKEISSQLETQEYADIADVYIKLAESNSSLDSDGTIFDYANFIEQYEDYLLKFSTYQEYVIAKAKPELLKGKAKSNSDDKMDALNVSLKESQNWFNRLSKLNNRVFGDYNFMKIEERF
jgi:tetratricopeptide (TPR) repeat protein